MTPSQPPPDPGIEDLLRTAEVFSRRAMQQLLGQASDDQQKVRELFYNYVDLACRLEVHFLFPNLDDGDRGVLAGLSTTRSAIQVGARNSVHYRSPALKTRHREAMQALKDNFLILNAEVGARGIRERLTEFQRRLLDREFTSVPREVQEDSALRRS